MILKRVIGIVLSAVLMLGGGCQKAQQIETKPKDEITGKITVWTDIANKYIFNTALSNYKKLHSSVQVDIVEINNNSLQNKLDKAIVDKTSLPDILCVEDENAKLLISKYKDMLEETSDDIKKDNYAAFKLENLTFEDKLYGIPLSGAPALMLYRNDILKEAAVKIEDIKTWSDYLETGKSVAKLQGKKMLWLPQDLESTYRVFVNQLGGSFISDTNELELNRTDKIQAAELLKQLYFASVVQGAAGTADLVNKVKQGSIASFIVSPKDLHSIYSSLGELKNNLIVKKLPAFEEGGSETASLGGENLLILKESKNKKVSLDFSLFTAEDRENIKMLMTNQGYTSAYMGYYDEIWFADNNWRLYANLLRETNTLNFTGNYVKIKPIITDSLNRIIINKEDAKTVLDEVQQKNLSLPTS